MTDSKARTAYIQDKPEVSCDAKNNNNSNKRMGHMRKTQELSERPPNGQTGTI